jgi:methylmalonyl-CoA mutase C-terminal domain/subunit
VRALPRVVLVELVDVGRAAVLARALRDEGIEVVHAGLLTSAAQVLSTVEQEDPDALGLVVNGAAADAEDAADLAEVVASVAAAIPELRMFGWRDSPDAVVRPIAPGRLPVFKTLAEVTDWLAGGRTHTPKAPSDRIR